MGAALASYTWSAAERVRQRVVDLVERSGPRTVLLAHEAGLIARYWEAGGRELLPGFPESPGQGVHELLYIPYGP
ncbi:hypothetical protein ACFYQA_01270 [Streptomyces sp. NPDC005774]|uniref:hypothetical protein n=1 Tax=Streptomyces sp. NPDC005774 TaxID=3364728 RepID=UPI0036C1663B